MNQDVAGQSSDRRALREGLQKTALGNALQKRELGVPTYTVPETAALMSVSSEYLYRLVNADAFPAIRMSVSRGSGKVVVPAKAVDALLKEAESGAPVDAAAWTERWAAGNSTWGGAA